MKAAEITVSYHPTTPPKDRCLIRSSTDAYAMIHDIWNMDKIEYREEFVVLYLDRRHGVIGHYLHSIGSDVATIVSVKQILAVALKVNATGLILMHNHPSGSLKPSRNDKNLTDKIRKAAELFEITVLDHLIITLDGYFSFADDGMM